jgi:hypothetical protein
MPARRFQSTCHTSGTPIPPMLRVPDPSQGGRSRHRRAVDEALAKSSALPIYQRRSVAVRGQGHRHIPSAPAVIAG